MSITLFFLAREGTQKKFLKLKVLVYFGPCPLEENVRPLKVDFAKKKLIFKAEFRKNNFQVFPSDEY